MHARDFALLQRADSTQLLCTIQSSTSTMPSTTTCYGMIHKVFAYRYIGEAQVQRSS
jgi:hypothetical protein